MIYNNFNKYNRLNCNLIKMKIIKIIKNFYKNKCRYLLNEINI